MKTQETAPWGYSMRDTQPTTAEDFHIQSEANNFATYANNDLVLYG